MYQISYIIYQISKQAGLPAAPALGRSLRSRAGFTFIELLIVIGVSLIVYGMSLSVSVRTQPSIQVSESAAHIVQTIRIAKNASHARFHGAAHGVFFENNATNNDRYIAYQGATYATRDTAYDSITTLDAGLSLSSTFPSSGDINFSKGLGVPSATGTVSLMHAVTGETKTITVNGIGAVNSD